MVYVAGFQNYSLKVKIINRCKTEMYLLGISVPTSVHDYINSL